MYYIIIKTYYDSTSSSMGDHVNVQSLLNERGLHLLHHLAAESQTLLTLMQSCHINNGGVVWGGGGFT